MNRRLIIFIGMGLVGMALDMNGTPATGQEDVVEAGRKRFEALCAVCHGADGRGTARGPDIVSPIPGWYEPRGHSEKELADLIRQGVPGAMPAFQLSDRELQEVVAFVRSLNSPAMENPPPGDVAAAEAFFFGPGKCSTCHIVKGRGTAIGPDLSAIGAERKLSDIEQSLRTPSAEIAPGYQLASLRLRDGRTLRGFLRNESNYDVQLQGLDGKFHFLERHEIAEMNREAQSLMPKVTASENELRDLLAYLSRLSGVRAVDADQSPPDSSATDSRVTETAGSVSWMEIVHPKPGNWPTYNGSLSGNRHSPLGQIHTGNVSQLVLKWVFPVPEYPFLEVTPVVVDGVMYTTAGNDVYALDGRNGRVIWHYQRPVTQGVLGDASAAINRGVAVLGDRVFRVTNDAHLIALHRLTGRLLWDVIMADYREHYGATSAPLVVRDLVMSGHSGGDEGVRGFLSAYRASSGQRVWRFWTIPLPGEPASETWKGSVLPRGCASTWLTGSYDPESNLLYWTTGNPCPDFNGDERQGDNLYSCSVLALEADTGKLRWYYQFTPHDTHDWDANEPVLLVDAPFRGRERKLLLQANRNGFFYVLDRLTGELLLAKPFVKKLTWASGIGPDRRPQLTPDSEATPEGTKICPAAAGATNWMASAYNPETGLFYVMALEKCQIFTKSLARWEPGKSFYGGAARDIPGEKGEKVLRAIDIQTGTIVWEYPQIGSADSWSGVLSTAGGLVFFGDDSGAFAAVDARTGKLLWSFQANAFWKASPMTYMVDGKQYVAVAAGSNIMVFGLP